MKDEKTMEDYLNDVLYLWRKETGNERGWPSKAELIQWLMVKAGLIEEE